MKSQNADQRLPDCEGLGFDFLFELVGSYCDNDKAFMFEVIHRLDVIAGESLKIKTNIGDIEKEIELQSDKIVLVSDLLVKVQNQTKKVLPKTSFGNYTYLSIMYLLFAYIVKPLPQLFVIWKKM